MLLAHRTQVRSYTRIPRCPLAICCCRMPCSVFLACVTLGQAVASVVWRYLPLLLASAIFTGILATICHYWKDGRDHKGAC